MRDISLNELIEYFNRFIEEKYADEISAKRSRRISENIRYLKAFQNYLVESNFDLNKSIEQLIEGDPYKFESFSTKLNKKHIKNIFSYEFIEFCRSQSINTIPLLPYYYYRGNNQYAKFQFNKEHQEKFIRFKEAFNENYIPLNQLSLILLNVFYRFPYEILKKLKIYDIHQDLAITGIGLLDGHKTTIRKPLADGNYTYVPVTEEAVAVLLKSAKLNEDGYLCNLSQRWIYYNFKDFLKKEFGFDSSLEFKRTIMHYLVGALGFDIANAYLGLGSRSHTKNTFSTETDLSGIFLLKEFYPLHPFYDQKFMYEEYDKPEITREFHEKSEGVIVGEEEKIMDKPTLDQIMNPLGAIKKKSGK